MEEQKKRYCFDIPIHCEHGHLMEAIGMQKENQEKTSQVKTWRFIMTASCEKCEKLMTFNVAVAITKKALKNQFLPRIKNLPNDRQSKRIPR
ncbi:MAG: hypothetical protein AAB772_00975 [Patescibacteria group bacterium]